MSEPIIHALRKQIETLKSFLESLMYKFLAPITESVKRLPTIIQEQTKFVQKGFSDQILLNLLVQTNTIQTKIKKASKLKTYESKRIEKKKDYVKLQVDDLLEKLESISKKLDDELNSRVKKLDKYALDFLDKSYNSQMRNYLSEFEIPALEKIKADEVAILSTRVEAIEKITTKINEEIAKIKELDHSVIDDYTFSSDKKGVIRLKVMTVTYKTPDGKADEVLFNPSIVKKNNNGTEIKPLIQLH